MMFLTADISALRDPFKPASQKNSLRGDLNSEKVTIFCYIERVLIRLQCRKVSEKREEKYSGGGCPSLRLESGLSGECGVSPHSQLLP